MFMGKIAIFGGSSWLGKSTLHYLNQMGFKNEDFILTSNTYKKLSIGEDSFELLGYDKLRKIKDEKIEILYLFSFPMGQINNEERLKENFDFLMDEFQTFVLENEIKKVFLASSGSVYYENWSKYTIYSKYKKKQEEFILKLCKEYEIGVQISRIFSVVAPFYDLESNYAFTSFINSAINKSVIEVNNPLAIRSYANFIDIVKMSIIDLNKKIYDASFWNIEILTLANIIGEIFNVKVVVNENPKNENEEYISDNVNKISNNKFPFSKIDYQNIYDLIKITSSKKIYLEK